MAFYSKNNDIEQCKSFCDLVRYKTCDFCKELVIDPKIDRDGKITHGDYGLLVLLLDSNVLTTEQVHTIKSKSTPMGKASKLCDYLSARPETDTLKIFDALRKTKQSELIDLLLKPAN